MNDDTFSQIIRLEYGDTIERGRQHITAFYNMLTFLEDNAKTPEQKLAIINVIGCMHQVLDDTAAAIMQPGS